MTQINNKDITRLFKKAPKWAMFAWIDAFKIGGLEPVFTEFEPVGYAWEREYLGDCGRTQAGDRFQFTPDKFGDPPACHGAVFMRPNSISAETLKKFACYRLNKKLAVRRVLI